MKEKSSEDLAHRRARQEWWKRLLKFAVPAIVVLSVILVIFFDPRALAVSFVFIILAILAVVVMAGGGKKKGGASHSRSHYKGRFGGVGGVGSRRYPPNLGRPKDASQKGSSGSTSSPYANPESYEALVQMYHQHPPAENAGPQDGSKKGQQSSAGANISNVGLIALLLGAVLVLWLFA